MESQIGQSRLAGDPMISFLFARGKRIAEMMSVIAISWEQASQVHPCLFEELK